MSVKTIQDELREAHERVVAMVDIAKRDDRDLTEDEQKEIDGITAKMKTLDGKRKRDEGFGSLINSVTALAPMKASVEANGQPYAAGPAFGGWGPAPRKSIGQQFVEHEVYQQIRAMPRGGQWQSQAIEINAAVTVDAFPAPPANAYPSGLRLQEYIDRPADWNVSALFAQGILAGSLIQYLREKVFTNATIPVAQGVAKPESTLTFESVHQTLIKLAHWIGCPDEMLEDIDGLRSYIDARMATGIIDKLEDQVVNGSGAAGNMLGIIATPGLTAPVAAAAGALASAIAVQRAAIYEGSRIRPDAVVMSPSTFAVVATQQATGGGGYLGGPGLQASGWPATLWGLRVVESPSVVDGTAIVGAFKQGGQLFRKGGVTVQATNSHSDFFVKNTTAIRAEIRAALVIYRPSAFGLVTGLTAA